ncbi:hypothetical protein H8356DRAFT_1338206 [Neocallimastix lanati (nom. inval.)]|jgi:hypothetical protein|nr:hypothetical protein H8356DRAFT_1338206 [Neocallimastix sp. JGI-2020a]
MPRALGFRTAIDAVLLSTALAGMRRVGRFEYATDRINNGPIRTVLETYLGVGEWVLDRGTRTMARYPMTFRRIPDDQVSRRGYRGRS